ncbi:MAG: hypothetical protein ACI4RJ_01655, partial [Alphaproteobacteria bacterium]
MSSGNTIQALDANVAREIFEGLAKYKDWRDLLEALSKCKGKYQRGGKGVAFAKSVADCLKGAQNPLMNIAKTEGGPIALCPDKAKTKLRVIIARD